MNIQIFGKAKCFDTKKAERYFKERRVNFQAIDMTKKAERYFKERRVNFQAIDMTKKGISPGELKSVMQCVGLEELVDWKNPDAALLKYLAYEGDKVEKLLDNPKLLRTPIVRNGKKATVGYCPDVWKGWE